MRSEAPIERWSAGTLVSYNMTAPTAIWLDCDPGHDDAMALLLAAHSPGALRLLGVSTVAGNQSVDKTTHNACRVLDAVGAAPAIKVVRGQDAPLLRPARHDPGIHGESGLDGSAILDGVRADPARLVSKAGTKGVMHMAESILGHTGGKVTLIATGALTNVALLLALYPEVKPALTEIVLMGGAMGIGNRHPVAEFNILCDPEAAQLVFTCGVRVVMVPLEVTHTALATPEVMGRITARRSLLSAMVVDLLSFFKDTCVRVIVCVCERKRERERERARARVCACMCVANRGSVRAVR